MRLTWLADTLRAAGLTVIEVPGWQTRGADTMQPGGLVVHHTAEARNSNPTAMADFLVRGRSDLAGPLCHLYLDRRGVYHVIAAGRANHAGSGGWKGLSGNSSVVGIECANDGVGEPWPDVQVAALVAGSAAVLAQMGRSADWLCGHREWAPTRKVDPYGIDLGDLRTRVSARMAQPADLGDSDLTSEERAKLRQLIASWEAVGSNPSFPRYLIPDYRYRRKQPWI